MEFDKITPATEQDRRLAEAKKLTLTPLHGDIAPDPEPDAEVVARHLNDGALANVSNDTEQNGHIIAPSKELLDTPNTPPASSKKTVIIAGTMSVIGLGLLVYAGAVLFKYL